jgi:hypothetical protein
MAEQAAENNFWLQHWLGLKLEDPLLSYMRKMIPKFLQKLVVDTMRKEWSSFLLSSLGLAMKTRSILFVFLWRFCPRFVVGLIFSHVLLEYTCSLLYNIFYDVVPYVIPHVTHHTPYLMWQCLRKSSTRARRKFWTNQKN